MSFDFKLPDLGEGIREAEILAVKVIEGQVISEDQILFEVETDKAVVEIPSPVAGKVLRIFIKQGQIVLVGSVMISIEESGQKPITKTQNISTVVSEPNEKSISAESGAPQTAPTASETQVIIATPATRQMAREMKIDLHKVPATGSAGKITKEDVLAYWQMLQNEKSVSNATTLGIAKSGIAEPGVTRTGTTEPGITKNATQQSNLPDFTKFGEIERVPMRSLRRKTAQLMALSWSKIPHVTHCDEANITALETFRIKYQEQIKGPGVKITVTAFIMKAVAIALQEFPEFNTSFDEQSEEIIFKRFYNLGMAVDTDRGLIVPVIKSVDKKNILELAIDINAIAEKARNAKLDLNGLQGATFTVTNIGAIGGTSATPIIHYPEAAILAVMKIKENEIFKNNKIESVRIMPLCLAFDHRLADGAQAARFMRAIITMLENPGSFEKYLDS